MGKYVTPQPEHNLTYVHIIRNNYRSEQKTLSPRATKSRRGRRRRDPEIPDRVNIRLAFAHDADSILHCSAYSRYLGKTQVFYMFENEHLTERVLHVQYVSKIARTIARCLSLNEDLVEATGLALDLGHAPFGYAGDEFLSKQLKKNGIGVFAHNAQSVRILENIEANGAGLNLTMQVLDGVLGHNGQIREPRISPENNLSWELLDAHCNQSLQQENAGRCILPSTLEGCVVRFSDVISYVGRDMEDAIASELISRNELPKEVRRVLGEHNIDIINNLVMDVINSSHEKDYVEFSEDVFKALRTLLEFNDERIYNAKAILAEKERLEKTFVELFEAYLDDLNTGDESLDLFRLHVNQMPEEYLRTTPPGRIVCDFIAGMTDDFLVNQYSRRFVPRSFGMRLKK